MTESLTWTLSATGPFPLLDLAWLIFDKQIVSGLITEVRLTLFLSNANGDPNS